MAGAADYSSLVFSKQDLLQSTVEEQPCPKIGPARYLIDYPIMSDHSFLIAERIMLYLRILNVHGSSTATSDADKASLACISIQFSVIVPIFSHHYGFRRKHSTLQQMLVFLNNVYNATSSNLQTDTIYLDFKNAFDRVPHNELLFKLWSIGITGNTWRWFQDYIFKSKSSVCLCQ